MPDGMTKFECSHLLQVVSLFALDSVLGTLVKENDTVFVFSIAQFLVYKRKWRFVDNNAWSYHWKTKLLLSPACGITAAAEDSESYDSEDIEGKKIVSQKTVWAFYTLLLLIKQKQ